MLLGNFNAKVGKSEDIDNLTGTFGENTYNSNGNLLIEIFQNCNLMVCNGRTLLYHPQWTEVQSCLSHKSIIDYIIIDKSFNESIK